MTDALSTTTETAIHSRFHLRVWEFVLRHPVISVAIVAFAVRMVSSIALTVLGIDDLVYDDRTYIALVRSKIDGSLASQDEYFQHLYSSTWAFLAPLTFVSRIFGTHVLVGQVVIVLWGALTAAVTTLIGLRTFSDRALAVLAGLVPALLPSQILWSSVWLKDATVSACLGLVALGVVIALRESARRQTLIGIATTSAGLVGLSGVRVNSFVLTCWCLAIVLACFNWRRPAIVFATAVLVVIVPWAGGAGVLGSHVFSRADELGTQRAAGAVSADSALVPPKPLGGAPGTGASTSSETNATSSNLKYLPRGIVAVLFRPFPWDASTSNASTFAKFDNLIWYGIAVLAILGLWAARRRREFALIVLLIAGTVGVYALAEGNLGTAYRHRGEVVWAIGLLACLFLDGRRRNPIDGGA